MTGADKREPIREWMRQKVDLPAKVQVVLGSDGSVFADGTALIRDISFTGARVSELKLKPPYLPAEPFELRLLFQDDAHRGIGARARPVRFGSGADFELGVEFVEFWAREPQGDAPSA